MLLRTQYEFLFVGRDEGSFVENYAYDLGEGTDNSGKIFINLEIQNNPAEAESIGETVFDTMRKTFFSDLEKEPYLRFEDAVKTVNKALAVLREEKVSKFIGNLNVIIAAIVGNDLFVTQCGDAEAYLLRRRLLSNISEGLGEDNSDDIFNNIASGTLEVGDVVLLSSTRLLRYVGKSDMAKLFGTNNLVASLGELKDFLSSEVLGRIGMIGVAVQESMPSLNQQEKGRIISHLQKEEISSIPEQSEEPAGKPDVKLKNMMAEMNKKVRELKARVMKVAAARGRAERHASGRVSGGGAAALPMSGWSKEKILAAIFVMVVVLTLGIMWLKNRAAEQQMITKYTTTLNEVREEIGSAETTGQYNKEQAGQMLTHAREKAIEVLNSGYNRAKANEMLALIDTMRDKLDGVVRPQAKVLVDLSLKRQNVSAMGLLGMKEKLFAYEYNALYPILLDKVQDPITIDENETVLSGSVYDDKGSLLFYTKSGKLIEYADNRISFVDSADGVFKKGVAIQAYNNKFYILDSANNQIWRYTRRRDKFDKAEAWNVNADVKNGVSLAIDGNIYVLNKDGGMTKIFNGSKEEFPIKKQPINPLTAPSKIYTELDMSQVYVLEPSTSRVLVFMKDDRTGGLNYTNQYLFEELKDIRDIYVDKDTNKLYLLDASKVYEVVL